MPHICWDEIQFFIYGLPFVGYGLMWLRARLRLPRLPRALLLRKADCPCPHDHAENQKHA